ncbi:helix-turn-helix domain-containing protein [Ulvibacter litoralis]|uniref:Helix-turn-helix n=1 Tax=Ulvibacter litoralis TaxID=227084 RepID=A0A1G7JTI9_9FLAO|nr:helix-turn-helix transcriptional regulator [Ulvibacter litoralis]GHC66141.1 hypothetical protein GCM10008083_33980 [Ulvibacter litoralis]SDF28242.1 Helix-turn-helix [Ulvibacter litoralis]
MTDTTIEKLLATIGKRIQKHRLEIGLQPEDIAEMTGLTAPTIRNIENGKETYFSNFIAVCLAINIHPKEVLDISISIKPLFELSLPRKEKTRLTPRIDSFLETDFFNIERTANDVVEELAAIYKIQTKTSVVSVILKRKVEESALKIRKKGRLNFYKKK